MYFTTSRKPGLKAKAFARDLAKSFPQAHYFSRGKKSIAALASEARYNGQDLVVIVMERQGNPIGWQGLKVGEEEWSYSFQAKVKLLKLRKELGKAKHKLEELKLQVKDKDLKKLLAMFEVKSEEEAGNLFKEEKKVLSFYSQGREIGPRFKLEAVAFEE